MWGSAAGLLQKLGTASMRILIADDHEIIRRAVITILRSRADIEECTEAVNGKDAVEKARESNPDLVLLDINMPVLDGFGAAKEIKQLLPEVPILFFSIYDDEAMMDQARSLGEGVVLKDQMGAMLLKAVDALLQKQMFFPC
jgi:DNA-binding NarL/FixJ family response regulator